MSYIGRANIKNGFTNLPLYLPSDPYHNPERGFEPWSSSECLLEFDTRSKPLGHHGRFCCSNFANTIFLFHFSCSNVTVWLHVKSGKRIAQIFAFSVRSFFDHLVFYLFGPLDLVYQTSSIKDQKFFLVEMHLVIPINV